MFKFVALNDKDLLIKANLNLVDFYQNREINGLLQIFSINSWIRPKLIIHELIYGTDAHIFKWFSRLYKYSIF
jgi:hypothetical protein